MMNYFKNILFALGCVACVSISFGQGSEQNTSAANAKEARGDRHYNDFAFIDAREAYINAVESGYRSANLLARLGDSYYFTGDYEQAAKWYGALFSFTQDIDHEYLYRYAQSLKTLGKYATADRLMTRLNELTSSDDRAALFSEEKNYLELIELQSGRFTIYPVPFNSELSDYGVAMKSGELVFTSNRKRRTATQRYHDWNDQPFSELYVVLASEEGDPKPFRGDVNTKYHESSAIFTKDGKRMYFTRNNYTDGEYGEDAAGINHLKLYTSRHTENGWEVPVELPFNSDSYSVAHPALSPDEKTLYFASDMPGGEGASDLYKVTIEENGYGTPVNLGDAINTEGRETFPFIAENGDLYFASDGHVGLGGLDIFVAEMNADGGYQEGYNIGRPINGKYDDFAFVINSATGLGYFASNRKGGMGEDDIYSFEQIEALIKNCQQSIEGEVRNSANDDLISQAKVVLLDADNNVIEETVSDAQGAFMFDPVSCSTGYAIRASKTSFSTAEKSFVTSGEYEGVQKKTLYLSAENERDMEIRNAQVGEDLAILLRLNPIYFDLAKSYIRPDAQIELLKVVEAMRRFPNLKIHVKSHTDSRASDAYNLKLSKERANATVAYIIGAGIDPSRITGDGYGETQLVNRCSNGVPCSEGEHQLNRRSEFIIVEK